MWVACISVLQIGVTVSVGLVLCLTGVVPTAGECLLVSSFLCLLSSSAFVVFLQLDGHKRRLQAPPAPLSTSTSGISSVARRVHNLCSRACACCAPPFNTHNARAMLLFPAGLLHPRSLLELKPVAASSLSVGMYPLESTVASGSMTSSGLSSRADRNDAAAMSKSHDNRPRATPNQTSTSSSNTRTWLGSDAHSAVSSSASFLDLTREQYLQCVRAASIALLLVDMFQLCVNFVAVVALPPRGAEFLDSLLASVAISVLALFSTTVRVMGVWAKAKLWAELLQHQQVPAGAGSLKNTDAAVVDHNCGRSRGAAPGASNHGARWMAVQSDVETLSVASPLGSSSLGSCGCGTAGGVGVSGGLGQAQQQLLRSQHGIVTHTGGAAGVSGVLGRANRVHGQLAQLPSATLRTATSSVPALTTAGRRLEAHLVPQRQADGADAHSARAESAAVDSWLPERARFEPGTSSGAPQQHQQPHIVSLVRLTVGPGAEHTAGGASGPHSRSQVVLANPLATLSAGSFAASSTNCNTTAPAAREATPVAATAVNRQLFFVGPHSPSLTSRSEADPRPAEPASYRASARGSTTPTSPARAQAAYQQLVQRIRSDLPASALGADAPALPMRVVGGTAHQRHQLGEVSSSASDGDGSARMHVHEDCAAAGPLASNKRVQWSMQVLQWAMANRAWLAWARRRLQAGPASAANRSLLLPARMAAAAAAWRMLQQ